MELGEEAERRACRRRGATTLRWCVEAEMAERSEPCVTLAWVVSNVSRALAQKRFSVRICPFLLGRSYASSRDCSGEVWVEWLTGDDGFEGGQQRHALLSEGGKVAAQAGERVGPRSERKHPETFCCTLSMRTSRSAWLLSKGTVKSSRKASTSSWPSHNRSSRLRAGDCLTRPRWCGRRAGGGLAACPAASSAR